jgi:glycosyltransferase 2 family protein
MSMLTRRTVVALFKTAIAAGLLTYLVFQARQGFVRIADHSLAWPWLVAALLCSLLTATLSFLRWHVLVRALHIPSRLRDTLRLGALGFALNFASLGSIGGDLFKAMFLAHRHAERRPEAVATVVADRALGLLTLLTIASCGVWMTGLMRAESPAMRVLAPAILTVTAIGWLICLLLIFVEQITGRWVTDRLETVPLIGKICARLLAAVQIYRQRKGMLVVATILSAMMAFCSITTFFSISRGLRLEAPTWTEHAVIVPIAGVVGAVPVTPSGFGTMELAVEKLYEEIAGNKIEKGDGTMVALGRRVTDIAVALVGLGFYFARRREVQDVIAEVEKAGDVPK